MIDVEDKDVLDQLKKIQKMLDETIKSLSGDVDEDATEGPEVEEPAEKSMKSLLARVR